MARKVAPRNTQPVQLNLNAGGKFVCKCRDGKSRNEFKILSDGTQPKHYFCACGLIYTEHDIPAHS